MQKTTKKEGTVSEPVAASKPVTVKKAKPRQAPGETIGIDLGDKVSQYCILNSDGEVIEQGSVRNREASLQKHFGDIPAARIALETGTQSAWISRLLSSYGHEVIVANARELYGLSRSDRKNDRNDAEKLARYARLDPALLHPICHRTEQQQVDLNAVRSRDALVRARTGLVNAARGMAKGQGERLPLSVTPTFGARAKKGLPAPLRTVLEPLLDPIDQLSVQIGVYDRLLAQIATERYPETARLRSVPGVGPVTALTYVLTLADARRFAHSRDVGPYLGLRPKQRQSGARDPQLGISKAGNGYLRKLLVQCAHYTLGHFGAASRLRSWGEDLAKRGGTNAKKRAILAVARKLAVLLHKLWVGGQFYQPFFGSAKAQETATALPTNA